MSAFLSSFLFVVLAEMGDKTQLLAMAFATRYPPLKVLAGVAAATILNHAFAVFFGAFLTTVIPLDVITLIAALSFVFFGLWTLKGDRLDGEDGGVARFGPVVTVAIAFFIAEMGDKTQLATISLAVQYRVWIWVLVGTTSGMLVADAAGIVMGAILHRKVPFAAVKWFSAVLFIVFGLTNVFSFVAGHYGAGSAVVTTVVTGLLSVVGALFASRAPVSCRDGREQKAVRGRTDGGGR